MAGIYLHIPFCKSRCHYCDFYSTTFLDQRERFFGTLAGELEAQRGFLGDRPLKTIYFGGGTPSLATPAMLAGVLDCIAGLWDCNALEEVTLEANPDDLTGEFFEGLAALPVNRLSIGIQSFDDGLLRFMNRRHTARSAVEAVARARKAGFSNISLDLIYGIPGMTPAQWEDSIAQAIALGAEHISAYHLTVEPRTEFGRRLENGTLFQTDEAVGEEHYAILCNRLAAAGYKHYEISNFALPGRRAVHNSAYWNGEPYLGVGPSAHSYNGKNIRRWNAQTLEEYLVRPEYCSETLSEEDLYNEYVMTALRTADGVDRQKLSERFGENSLDYFEKNAAKHLASEAMLCRAGRYVIPEQKFLISDTLIASLFK